MHGMLKLIAKIKASPCAWVKFADKISEMPEALPATLAPKVELTRLPPVPYNVFNTPSSDSFEIADAQKARKVCHFSPKNIVTDSMTLPNLYRILDSAFPPKP